jgi:hypothetical protein
MQDELGSYIYTRGANSSYGSFWNNLNSAYGQNKYFETKSQTI